MIGDGLDPQQRALLWRIYRGEKSFPPPADRRDAAACGDHNFLVATLISLGGRGYIAHGKLHIVEARTGGGCRYHSVLVDGLSYEGMTVARSLDPVPAAADLSDTLSAQGLHQCRRDFERALGSVTNDPEQAVASACSLLESICKAILERRGAAGAHDKLGALVKATVRTLDLGGEAEAESGMRLTIDALASAAQALGTVRNKAGSAHGRSPGHTPLEPRHARLAANAAATVGLFLLETALAKQG